MASRTSSRSSLPLLVKIVPLRDGSHRHAGRYDNAARWYPGEAYRVPGSFGVRGPSRRWPYSYLKHYYSAKYARLLAESRPDLYCELQGIALESEQGRAILAQYAAHRLAA